MNHTMNAGRDREAAEARADRMTARGWVTRVEWYPLAGLYFIHYGRLVAGHDPRSTR